MLLFIFLLIFYCIPISLVILGFRWVLRKEGKKRKAKNFTKYAFLGLFICLIGLSIAGYISRRYVFEFNLKDKYAIELIAIEEEGYLDFPVNFYMQIQDLNSGLVADFEFSSIEGPYFQFYLDPEATEVIYLRGTESNIGRYHIIDMANKTLQNEHSDEAEIFEDLTLCAEISQGFELILK